MSLIKLNTEDSKYTRQRYIIQVGTNKPTNILVWANSLDTALDLCADWAVTNAPELLADVYVEAEYNRLLGTGMSDEEAREESVGPTLRIGNVGNYIYADDIDVLSINPGRSYIKQLDGEQ